MYMIRGTTAQFKFKLPCKKGDLGWATIKFWQPGNPGIGDSLPITKRLEHCSGSDDAEELCVSLLPKETMRFSDKTKAKVQLRALKKEDSENGTIFASHQQSVVVYPVNDDILNDDNISDIEDSGDYVILDGQPIVT
jgi:hypothetical protein